MSAITSPSSLLKPLVGVAVEPLPAEKPSVAGQLVRTGSQSLSPEAQRLRKVAQDFESVFLRQMLSGLERTTQVSSGGRSQAGQQTYGSMVVDAVAEAVSGAGGLGLADMLANELSARIPLTNASAPSNETIATQVSPGSRPAELGRSHSKTKIFPQGLSPIAVPRAEIRTSAAPMTGLLADRRIR